MSELPNLIGRQEQIKASLTKFWKMLKTENIDIPEIEKTKYEKYGTNMKKFKRQ